MVHPDVLQAEITDERGSQQVLMGWHAFQHRERPGSESPAAAAETDVKPAGKDDRLLTMLYWACSDD